MGALMLVVTGCPSEECIDQFDCNNSQGSPGTGKTWACVENRCVARDVNTEPPPTGDAGTNPTPDAGTETDAGTPGEMTIDEGGDCATTASCMAGLYCNPADSKCAPLHIAVTVGPTTGSTPTYAVVVPYNKTVSATRLSEDAATTNKFPRWNQDGSAVAFVDIDTNNNVSLVSRALPLETSQLNTLVTGAAANTKDFSYMEWAPSNTIAWSRTFLDPTTNRDSTTGIWAYTPPDGPAAVVTSSGVFPSWASDGASFVYSANGLGLQNRVLTDASSGSVPGPTNTTAEQPLHNKTNGVLLYLDAKGNVEAGLGDQPLTSLYTVNTTPTAPSVPTENEIALARDEGAPSATGQLKSYIANHTWAPAGTHVAYVRVFYFQPLVGDPYLCSGSNCGGQQGNVVYVRRIDPATGTPSGDELKFADEATLPSFSPDGQFLAYVSGAQLKVQKIDPNATTAETIKVAGAFSSHDWSAENRRVLSNRGDDHRPRWQPR
ncbi:hypothetical protein BON30_07585 [Cystobacter ferrugineus]|uniref:Lipoprotein LpqB beta-propeller domain-containing protein n=2 Tax=Cystobacter ferrugineus TaxID=83449 RepID=A0A1L9BEV4_9BACT|nr:hypothetical protein BON30_07585 [Cystobacter ferrugineus]